MSLGTRKPLQRRTPLKTKKCKPGHAKHISRKSRQDQVQARPAKRDLPKRAYMRRKKHPDATPEEKAHMGKVARMPCYACEQDQREKIEKANVHHIREGYRTGERASNWEVIPLGEGHHQGLLAPVDKTKIAFHRSRRTFVLRYGNEIGILATVLARIGLTLEDIPRLRGSEPPWWAKYKRGGYDEEIDAETRRVLAFPQEIA